MLTCGAPPHRGVRNSHGCAAHLGPPAIRSTAAIGGHVARDAAAEGESGRAGGCARSAPAPGARRPAPQPQTLTVPSTGAATTCRRCGVTAHTVTRCVWPSSIASACSLTSCQPLSVLTYDAETTCWPSGVTAHATRRAWSSSVATARPLFSSQTLSVRSRDAETTCRPSGAAAHASP